MNKKIILMVMITLIVLIGGIVYIMKMESSNKENNKVNNSVNSDVNINNNSVVLYFSVTNNTKKVAELVADVSNSNLIEIVPEQKYSADDINYNNNNSRANKEQNDSNARPKIKNKFDIDNYDVVYLGFPIWWGDTPKIILTLLDEYNFDGKTVIPFCTSGSSGISTAENTLKNYNKKMIVKEGRRFSSTSTKEDITKWINK